MSETRMMSFLEHLGEFRKKVTVSLIAMCVMLYGDLQLFRVYP